MEQKKTTDSVMCQSELMAQVQAMTLNAYQDLAMRTSKPLSKDDQLLHSAMGLCSEAGELMTPVKAAEFYGKRIDNEHIIEELGDLLWFLQLGCVSRGVTLEECARRNLAKLAKRYPDKYSDFAAIARADKQDGATGD